MQLVLVRHGEPEIIEHDPSGADPALTERGQAQAEAVGKYLAAESFDAIWASPMRRAVETAAPLAAALEMTVQHDERFAEFDRGDTSYKPPADLTLISKDQATAMMDRMQNPAFLDAVSAGVDDMIERYPTGKIVVFCHGGVISAAVGTSIRKPEFMKRLMPVHSGVTRIDVAENGYRSMRSFNESQWLLT